MLREAPQRSPKRAPLRVWTERVRDNRRPSAPWIAPSRSARYELGALATTTIEGRINFSPSR